MRRALCESICAFGGERRPNASRDSGAKLALKDG
jgi:hypothetical protein